MKLALISDVHANAVALRAVLDDIDSEGVSTILSAGDVIGYYPYPNETLELFNDRGIISIAGNHDVAVLLVDPSGMNPYASRGVIWTARALNRESLEYLRGLEKSRVMRIADIDIALYHGSPRDDEEYLYEEMAEEELLELCNADVLVLGHTHVPFVKRLDNGLIVNPGSVGQPRDGDPRASYSLLDTETMEVENRRITYDIDKVIKATNDAGLPRDLGKRLLYGV